MSRCPFLVILVSVLLANGQLVIGQEDDHMIDEVMKDKKMSDMVKKMAMSSMDMVKDQDMEFLKAGVDTTDTTSTTAMKAMFTNTEERAREMGEVKRSQNLLLNELSHMLHVPKRRMADSMKKLLFELGIEIQGLGTKDDNCDEANNFRCNPRARFRNFDGTCNNLRKPVWGAAFISLRRFLKPVYDDDVSSPRTLAKSGQELPSARVVSLGVHEDKARGPAGARASHMLMQWGQFLDHDFTSTPRSSGASGSNAGCCSRAGIITPGIPPEERDICFPIKLPPNDPKFAPKRCLNFVRSVQVDNTECGPAPVEQMNQITAFIDGSMVYGSSQSLARSLRAETGGLLKTSPNDLLPANERPTCVRTKRTDFCFKAGDARVNEQMALATLHTVWMREHNRMARELSRINPAWGDEKLYQETRRIVGAKLQHITYNEFLPEVLGEEHMQHFRLTTSLRGFDEMYDDQTDPSIRNSFATAAYRFGHSLVRTMFSQMGSNFKAMKSLRLKSSFGNTSHLIRDDGDGVNRYIRGLVADKANKIDRFMSVEVTQHLFEDRSGNSLDLAAINIQRGRDHGLPGYNAWRKWCNLPVAQKFNRREGGLVDHPNHAIRKLANVYNDTDDIDLFAGGISEQPVRGGLVGPTFACILSHQFKALKVGDRYWYERPSPDIGFTENQLDAIRQTTLAKILCDNTDILKMQPNAFQVQWRRNRRQRCEDLTQISLEAWSDDPAVRDNAVIHFDDNAEDNSINNNDNNINNDNSNNNNSNGDNGSESDGADTGAINDNDDTEFNDNTDNNNNNEFNSDNDNGDNSVNNGNDDSSDTGNEVNTNNDSGLIDKNENESNNDNNGFGDNNQDDGNKNGDDLNDGNSDKGNIGNDKNQGDSNDGNSNLDNELNGDTNQNNENDDGSETRVTGPEDTVDDTGNEHNDFDNNSFDNDEHFRNDNNGNFDKGNGFRNNDNLNQNDNFDNSGINNNNNDNRNTNSHNNRNNNRNNRNNSRNNPNNIRNNRNNSRINRNNSRNNSRNNRNNSRNNNALPQRNNNRQRNNRLAPWAQWSICLRGKNTRIRTCFKGKPCRGRTIQTKGCGRNTWTSWSEWSACVEGQERRQRKCTGRMASCEGPAREFRPCANLDRTEVTWGPWGTWGSCANGKRFRRRSCQAPSGGQRMCVGPSSDSEMCGTRSVDCSQDIFRIFNPDLCS